MKKKIFSAVGVVAFTVVIAFNINLSMNNNAKMDVTLANVEALGQIECTAYDNCATNCPYEYCGYCNGFYFLECPQP